MQSIYVKALFWVCLVVLAGYFVAAINDVLLPFVVGILLAYFLDPLADKMEASGISRGIAALMIVVVFSGIFIGALAFILPIMVEQFTTLASNLPGYISEASDKYAPRVLEIIDGVNEDAVSKIKESATGYATQALGIGGNLAAGVFKSGMAFLNIVSLIFISPIVAFYILRDWDRIKAKIDSWLPRKSAKTIREQLRLMDRGISGFIRGQTNVCMLLAIFYATGLSAVGLSYGVLIGILTGLLSFIPYMGMLVGTVLGLSVAFFQTHDITHVLMVAAVFAAGQFVEGNFITPRLVGDKVGLHPVWIIFALLSGGALFGFLGVLIAVPLAAIVAVLVRFAIAQYLASSLYAERPKSGVKVKRAK